MVTAAHKFLLLAVDPHDQSPHVLALDAKCVSSSATELAEHREQHKASSRREARAEQS